MERLEIALRTLLARIACEARFRRDIAELRRMDNHLLADLGIARDQIEAYVRGSFETERAARRPELRLVAGCTAA